MLVPELEVDDELALAAAVTLFPGPDGGGSVERGDTPPRQHGA